VRFATIRKPRHCLKHNLAKSSRDHIHIRAAFGMMKVREHRPPLFREIRPPAYYGPSGPMIPLEVGRSFRCDVGRIYGFSVIVAHAAKSRLTWNGMMAQLQRNQ
jgi:hypothetical protein